MTSMPPQINMMAAPTGPTMLAAPQTNMMAAPTGQAFSLQGNPASVTAPVKTMQMQAPAMQMQTAQMQAPITMQAPLAMQAPVRAQTAATTIMQPTTSYMQPAPATIMQPTTSVATQPMMMQVEQRPTYVDSNVQVIQATTAPVVAMNAPIYEREVISTRAPTTYFEQAYAPTTFASAVPTTVIEQPAYMRAGPTYVEPVSYSAPARVEERFSYAVPSVSMSSYGAGKDLKAGGRVVSERPISREELSAHGNLSESMSETRQGTYSNNGFAASRVAPVAFEQSAFIGSSRPYTGIDPFRQSSSFRTQVDYGMTYAGGMRQMDYGAAPMASYGGGVTMIG